MNSIEPHIQEYIKALAEPVAEREAERIAKDLRREMLVGYDAAREHAVGVAHNVEARLLKRIETLEAGRKEIVFLNGCIDSRAYGARGDGTYHRVQEWIGTRYRDLAELQEDYPWVSSLDDSADWAAIQAALNASFREMVDRYGSGGNDLTRSMAAASPKVYIGPGRYVVNKSLIVPPRCRVVGAGEIDTIISYQPRGDAMWPWLHPAKQYEMPENPDVHCVFVRLPRMATANPYVTTGIYSVDGPIRDSFLSAQDGEHIVDYFGEMSGFLVNSDVDPAVMIWLPSYADTDSITFRNIHFNGYGSQPNQWCYGIMATRSDGQSFMKNLTVKDCTFELLRVGIGFLNSEFNHITGNRFWDTWKGITINNGFYTQILGNTMELDLQNFDQYPSGHTGIEGAFEYANISNNVVQNFRRAIRIGGIGVNATNNAVAVPGDASFPAMNHGYVVGVFRMDKMSGINPKGIGRPNRGVRVTPNTWEFMGSVPPELAAVARWDENLPGNDLN